MRWMPHIVRADTEGHPPLNGKGKGDGVALGLSLSLSCCFQLPFKEAQVYAESHPLNADGHGVGKDLIHQVFEGISLLSGWQFATFCNLIVGLLHGSCQLTELCKRLDDGNGGFGCEGRLDDGGEHVKPFLSKGFRKNC